MHICLIVICLIGFKYIRMNMIMGVATLDFVLGNKPSTLAQTYLIRLKFWKKEDQF